MDDGEGDEGFDGGEKSGVGWHDEKDGIDGVGEEGRPGGGLVPVKLYGVSVGKRGRGTSTGGYESGVVGGGEEGCDTRSDFAGAS